MEETVQPLDRSSQMTGLVTLRLKHRSLSFSIQKVLGAIIVVAVLLRLASALYQGNSITDLPGIFDQISYDGLARRVVQGYGFSFAEDHWPATRGGEPTAHWSYLYTLYLVAVYKLFGTYPVVARVIQALIAGILQPWLIYRIGSRLFNRTVGLLAAFLTAVYIYFFYYAGALVTETFYILAILWIFDVAFRLMDAGTDKHSIPWWKWLELGLAIGVAVLLRQVFLLFLPFLYLWLWWNIRDVKAVAWGRRLHWQALGGLTVVTAVLALMILPFTIRNYRAFHTFVLLNTNAGFAFFWGNHPVYGTHFIPLLPAEGPVTYQKLLPRELLSLNEAQLDKALLGRGLQFIADDPKRFLLLSLSRTVEFFKFWPAAHSGWLSNISRVGSFGIALPFMLIGLWISMTRTWKSRDAAYRWQIVLLLSFLVIYTAIHLLSWTLIRYRLPIDAILLVFAALTVESFFTKVDTSNGKVFNNV